jgi:hypothetical protein
MVKGSTPDEFIGCFMWRSTSNRIITKWEPGKVLRLKRLPATRMYDFTAICRMIF